MQNIMYSMIFGGYGGLLLRSPFKITCCCEHSWLTASSCQTFGFTVVLMLRFCFPWDSFHRQLLFGKITLTLVEKLSELCCVVWDSFFPIFSIIPSLISQVSDLHFRLKALFAYSFSLSLHASQVFPPINLFHI